MLRITRVSQKLQQALPSTTLVQVRFYQQKYHGRMAKKEPKEKQVFPDFQSLMRKFYIKSHPDLLRASDPQMAATNDESFQTLNGILATIKKPNDFPPMMSKKLPFYIRDGTNIKLYELKLRSAGGDNRHLFKRIFTDFFKEIGITTADSFEWNKDYFPPQSVEEALEAMKKEAEDRKREQEEEYKN